MQHEIKYTYGMIHIDCKITNFSFLLFVYSFL